VTTNREVFDEIAESWYRVRHWPLLRDDLDALAARWQGGKLLNVGCAHGPDFLPFRQGFELYGVDCSPGMVRQAIGYSGKFNFYVNLAISDALSLPFADNTFDWAISVATYHHIKGRQERERAFIELKRVLKPEGEAFLTVWNWGQPRFWFKSKEQRIPWKLKKKDSLPVLSPVFLRGATKIVGQKWLGSHFNVAGEVLPLPHEDLLTQHMRSDTQGQ
jgi:tRNA (uracil-5-)-methyltransferase TRM9